MDVCDVIRVHCCKKGPNAYKYKQYLRGNVWLIKNSVPYNSMTDSLTI